MSVNKRKGTMFESAVVAYLRPTWPEVERRALAGNKDKGDIANVPGCVIECKSVRAITLAEFADETEIERGNASATFGVTVIKRRGKSVRDAYAVVPLWQMVELLKDDTESEVHNATIA